MLAITLMTFNLTTRSSSYNIATMLEMPSLSSIGNDASLFDLSKLMSSSSLYPPRSQIKRQKMIYHCKFGEFGVMPPGRPILP